MKESIKEEIKKIPKNEQAVLGNILAQCYSCDFVLQGILLFQGAFFPTLKYYFLEM